MDVIDRWKVMPKDPTPPIRQGFGTLGRNIPLRANYYEVKVENWKQDLVHYDVVIKEPKREEKDLVISKSRKMKIFKALEEKYSDIFKVHNLAFDGMKSAVSTGVIEEFKDGKAHQLQVEVINDRGKSNIYIIILKVVNKTSLYDLWQFLKRKKEFPATVFQLIEIMFRHTPSSNHLSIGQNSFYSFDNDWDRFRTISNGMIAAQGFFASLRPAQWKDGSLLLNVDVTHALFYKEQPVIDFMKDNDIIPRQETYLNRLLTTEEKKKLSEKLIGLKVCVTHTGCARTYKVNEILDVGASTQEFKQEKTGLSQTVLDYFADVYPRARISYPELNLLWVGALTKTVYLPIEFCKIAKEQKVKRKVLADSEAAEFIKFTAKGPRDREEDIRKIFQKNKFEEYPLMKQLGFSFDNKLLELKGRVLDAPELTMKKFDSGIENVPVTPTKGCWDVRHFAFMQAANIQHWEVVNYNCWLPDSEILAFVSRLILMAKDRGMTMAQAKITPCNDKSLKSVFEALGMQNPKPQLLLVILPSKKPEYYARVKTVGDRTINIVTQCVLFDNVKKQHPATIGNLLFKINAKVGGINNSIGNKHHLVLDRPVMFMGADVNHPPASDVSGLPSVAAVVASTDQYAAKYAVEVRNQKARLERIEDMKEMTKNLILTFYRITGHRPERIIMFRDGVGESQFLEVLKFELNAMREACLSIDKTFKPGITFIVVQKRHHTRFFPVNQRHGVGNFKNVPPGTVVDTAVTHPNEIDYFLASHLGIQGTSKPTHYRVLWDDNDFTMDQLQYMSYAICHMYARCSRSVSIPTPAYYAHLAAYRGKVHLHELCGGQTRSRLHGEKGPEFPYNILQERVKMDKSSEVTKRMYFL